MENIYPIKVIYEKRFTKKFKKLPIHIKTFVEDRIKIFYKNQYDPVLNNHQLKGNKKHLRTINITGDIRLVFETIGKNVFVLVDIDNHNNLYG